VSTNVYELKRDGARIFQTTETEVADPEELAAGGGAFELVIPADLTSEPGSYELRLSASGVEDEGVQGGDRPFSTEATVSFVVQEPSTPVTVQPASLSLQAAPGSVASGSFSITAGNGPFALSAARGELSADNADLGDRVTYRLNVGADETPGTELSDSVTVTPASGSAVTVPVTVRVIPPESMPIVVEPSALSLQGKAGETATASFSIVSGTPPFSLESGNAEGRGSFSDPSPGLGETVTYGFRIPSSATDAQRFVDTITVTAADGSTATVVATVTVSAATQPPSQAEIDDAMQSIAVTEPQRSTAAVISEVCPAGVAAPRLQQDCNVLVGASFNAKTEASLALGQVTADQASAPVDASQTSIQSQIRNVGTRIAALRGGITGFSARGLTVSLDGERLPVGAIAEELVAGLAGVSGGAAGDSALAFGPWGVFINGSVSSGDKDRTENVDGFDFDAVSVTLGADYRFRDNLIAGAALGYARNDTDLDGNGGELDADGFSLSLYGTYYSDGGLYLDGIVTYGWSDYDQKRNIRYDIGSVRVDQTAISAFDGSEWSASFGGGYSLSNGPFSFGPTARLEYVSTSVDGFQERMSNPAADGGGWATRIEDQDVSSFTSQLGGEISYAVSTGWGVLLPNLHLEWVHEFEDGADQVAGHFVQDPTRTQFLLPTDDVDRDYFNLRLGVSAQFAEGRAGYIYYRKLFGYRDLEADTIAAGLRLEF
jgi:outer membrane autotransporter protein